MNAVLRLDKTQSDLATYHHACAGFPTKSSFITAINNGVFNTWPGLNAKLITKCLPPSIPTIKGHLKQEQQNLHSTQESTMIKIEPGLPQNIIESNIPNSCYLIITTKEFGTTYSDLTGRYPITSSRGNQYILICYDYNTNSIQAQVTRTCNAAEIRDATLKML